MRGNSAFVGRNSFRIFSYFLTGTLCCVASISAHAEKEGLDPKPSAPPALVNFTECAEGLQRPVHAPIYDRWLKRTFKNEPEGAFVKVEIWIEENAARPLLEALVGRSVGDLPLDRRWYAGIRSHRKVARFERAQIALGGGKTVPGYRFVYGDVNYKVRALVQEVLPQDPSLVRVDFVSVY